MADFFGQFYALTAFSFMTALSIPGIVYRNAFAKWYGKRRGIQALHAAMRDDSSPSEGEELADVWRPRGLVMVFSLMLLFAVVIAPWKLMVPLVAHSPLSPSWAWTGIVLDVCGAAAALYGFVAMGPVHSALRKQGSPRTALTLQLGIPAAIAGVAAVGISAMILLPRS